MSFGRNWAQFLGVLSAAGSAAEVSKILALPALPDEPASRPRDDEAPSRLPDELRQQQHVQTSQIGAASTDPSREPGLSRLPGISRLATDGFHASASSRDVAIERSSSESGLGEATKRAAREIAEEKERQAKAWAAARPALARAEASQLAKKETQQTSKKAAELIGTTQPEKTSLELLSDNSKKRAKNKHPKGALGSLIGESKQEGSPEEKTLFKKEEAEDDAEKEKKKTEGSSPLKASSAGSSPLQEHFDESSSKSSSSTDDNVGIKSVRDEIEKVKKEIAQAVARGNKAQREGEMAEQQIELAIDKCSENSQTEKIGAQKILKTELRRAKDALVKAKAREIQLVNEAKARVKAVHEKAKREALKSQKEVAEMMLLASRIKAKARAQVAYHTTMADEKVYFVCRSSIGIQKLFTYEFY